MINQYIIKVKYKYTSNKSDIMYASSDIHGGSFSTGFPCWTSNIYDVETFNTKEEAIEWYYKHSKDLLDDISRYNYVIERLVISKIILSNICDIDYNKTYEEYKFEENEKRERKEYEKVKARYNELKSKFGD